jgi:2-polyprenyl-3-methyl-5-hydroxy-6-metoxy-1,4-benzoquinol methylase
LYQAGSDVSWSYAPEARHDWCIAKALLESLGATQILDIGCFDGTVLSTLSPAIGRYGIEINEAAAERARQRRVEIVGHDLAHVSDLAKHFDAVSAFDLAEHIHDPSQVMRALVNLVKPGGILIVSTGNSEALTWRIVDSRYWYCRFAEHISFMNAKYFRALATQLGVEIAMVHRFSHARTTQSQRCRELVANLIYVLSPPVNRLFDKIGFTIAPDSRYGRLVRNGACWISAKDHMLIALRKPS